LVADGFQSFWLGNMFTVVINNPEDLKIMLHHEHCFEKYKKTYQYFFKYGLFTEGGEKYKAQKKSLNPLFSPSNLKSLTPIINKNYKYFMDNNYDTFEGQEFEMKDLAARFTINTVFSTLIGIDSKMIPRKELEKTLKVAEEFLATCGSRLFKIWMHSDFIYKFTKEYKTKQEHKKFMLDILVKIVEENDAKSIEGITFFNCMKHHLDKMEYEEYCDSITLFIGASYETTAATLSFIFFFLALHQDKQEILYNEISSILSSTDDEVNEKMMTQMHYVDLVIKETLRLLPIATYFSREATADVEFSKLNKLKQLHHLCSISHI
jgi:cytochrome P450